MKEPFVSRFSDYNIKKTALFSPNNLLIYPITMRTKRHPVTMR